MKAARSIAGSGPPEGAARKLDAAAGDVDEEQQGSEWAERAGEGERVGGRVVLDDAPVADAADDDPGQRDLAAAVAAVQRPARGDALAFGQLVVDVEAQIV